MVPQSREPYLEPVSEGMCEVVDCSSPAGFRASWAQGVIIRLLCPTHKTELEGEVFDDLSPTIFGRKRRAK